VAVRGGFPLLRVARISVVRDRRLSGGKPVGDPVAGSFAASFAASFFALGLPSSDERRLLVAMR
jgi:hypothetical protein